jgi:hypothetical protein
MPDLLAAGAIAGVVGARRAISRLIAGVADIPVAKLEQISQGIRDHTKAKTTVSEILAANAAEVGLTDPMLLERGFRNLLGRAYREQQYREAIAKEAVEFLKVDPPPLDTPGPSDDFMDNFESYAAKASTAEMQQLFAQILAGEIRQPQSFSRQTLQLVSMLDQQTADAIKFALSLVFEDRFICDDQWQGDDLEKMQVARGFGIIATLVSDVSLTPSTNPYEIVLGPTEMVQVLCAPGYELRFGVIALQRQGRELLQVVGAAPSNRRAAVIVEHLKRDGGVQMIKRITFSQPGLTGGFHQQQHETLYRHDEG